MLKKINLLILLILFMASVRVQGQNVYEHISNQNIYDFVDELANAGIINLNSAVKPYSRKFIADALVQAAENQESLNKRQRNEVSFYLLNYKLEIDSLPDYNQKFDVFGSMDHLATAINPLGLFYKDKLFSFGVKPIWGINYFINDKESIYHRWGGAEAFAYIGKRWAFYASLRDNNETVRISEPEYFTRRPGGAYKGTPGGGGDYSEMRGGVTYSWKWGSVGLVKDHLNWGNNQHGPMIFSDRAPSFAQIKLQIKPVKWFELNYFHGWLVSMEIDSVRSYYSSYPPREVYRPKYVAANIFTFTPWKRLDISIGNSIIYSDMNVHPAYLIPVMFYKSIDHTLNEDIDNQNSQMFLDISSRNIRNLHLYGTLYIDELKLDRIGDPTQHNVWSFKVGAKETNILLKNISINIEYSRSMPLTYEHRVPTLTFASNNYNLGYYLRDNSQEIFAKVTYKPLKGLLLKTYYILAQHGPDHPFDITTNVVGNPFMERVTWQNQTLSFGARYEFINNAYLFAEYIMSDITGDEEQVELYTPAFYRGQNNTISVGFNLGF
ncbi:MAG: hypothetical protein KQI35_03630 [Bacteroidetes bacterium]|nr:hypothetical protein [Bacteroidota bacterium]